MHELYEPSGLDEANILDELKKVAYDETMQLIKQLQKAQADLLIKAMDYKKGKLTFDGLFKSDEWHIYESLCSDISVASTNIDNLMEEEPETLEESPFRD